MMRKSISIYCALTGLIFSGCGQNASFKAPEEQSALAADRAARKFSDPVRDFQEALKKGDLRFLGIEHGVTMMVPGLPTTKRYVDTCGIRILDVESAGDYATNYNHLLFDHLLKRDGIHIHGFLDSEERSVTPDEVVSGIQTGIIDLGYLWAELKREQDQEIIQEYFFQPTDKVLLTRFDDDIDGDGDTDALIRMTHAGHKLFHEFLIFTKDGGRWHYAGNIDLMASPKKPPRYKVVSYGRDRTFLIIERIEPAYSAEGYISYEEWFQVYDERHLFKALKYANRMDFPIGWKVPGVEFTTKVESADSGGPWGIVVRFEGGYINAFPDESLKKLRRLLSFTKTAQYIWNKTDHKFVFDATGSNTTEQDVFNTFLYETADPFLAQNYNDLIAMVKSGDALKKKWFKRFIGGFPHDPALDKLVEER